MLAKPKRRKSCRVIQLMKNTGSTKYTILLFYITAEATIGSVLDLTS